MLILSPGLKFVLKKLPPLVALVVFVYLLGLPLWACLALIVVSPPVSLAAYTVYYDVKQRRDAAAMGARVVPRVVGNRSGNLDVLQRLLKIWDNGYLGMSATGSFHRSPLMKHL